MNIDKTRLASALGGDRTAAASLIESLWPDAYRIAWATLRDSNAAEDAAQEACARAWRALSSLRSADRFAVWFYRIVVNECRRSQRNTSSDLRLVDRLPVAAGEPFSEDRVDVRRAIDRLPAPLRLVVVLRYYYDLSSVEIAEVVSASPITVRWRLMLAHRRLRSTLTAPEKDYQDETVAFG